MTKSGFMADTRLFSKNALEINGRLNVRVQQTQDGNITWVGYVEENRRASDDDIGALYYVVAVILIYGLSIVMMIASHIRKNKQDNQLRTYLKEMAKLRKDDRREKVLCKINDIAKCRQQHEAKQNSPPKVKDGIIDREIDTEAFRPLMTKETSEDTTDSAFHQPYWCVSADSHSPSPSECKNNAKPGRSRSLSYHEGTRRKSSETRSAGAPDSKTMRLQDKRSPNLSDPKSIIPPKECRRASINDFHLSPLCGGERSSTVHEVIPHRLTTPKSSSPINSKIPKISETGLFNQAGEIKPLWSTNFHVVNEDAVL